VLDEQPALCSAVKKLKTKHIFVDEAQDLNPMQYAILQRLATLQRASLHLIGDPNQAIYQYRDADEKLLLCHAGDTYYLSTNYRCGAHINTFASYFKHYEFN